MMPETAKQIRRNNFRVLITGLLAFMLLVSFNIWYTNYVQRQSDQRWCELIPSLDDRYQALNTEDPEAIRFRGQVNRIRKSLPCEKTPSQTPLPAVSPTK
jgi:hypothetical protein